MMPLVEKSPKQTFHECVMKYQIVIIMGSGVLPDGSASRGMRRRVKAALQLREEFNDLIFIPTGGIAPGRPRSEADAMRDLLLQAGVKSECIVPETRAKNTLHNVINSAHIIKKLPLSGAAIVCSVNFHIPRCRMLLYLMGISTTSRPMPAVSRHIGWIRRAYFYCREAVAIPVDIIILLVLKAFRKV
jgi:uncharacterized SAM-binding protein YcdF (DUF218 family)